MWNYNTWNIPTLSDLELLLLSSSSSSSSLSYSHNKNLHLHTYFCNVKTGLGHYAPFYIAPYSTGPETWIKKKVSADYILQFFFAGDLSGSSDGISYLEIHYTVHF